MKSNHSSSVNFFVRRDRESFGCAPLYVKITVDGKKANVPTKHTIQLSQWNQKAQRGSTLPNSFTYSYDGLNRLSKGASTGIVMSEELSYDVMGNIKTMQRENTGLYSYNYGEGNRLAGIANLTPPNQS